MALFPEPKRDKKRTMDLRKYARLHTNGLFDFGIKTMIYLLLIIPFVIGLVVGLIYKKQGYTFHKVFIGAWLGFTALAFLIYQMFVK